MQHRMKTHPLSQDQMEGLLDRAQTACLATINADGTPYVVPVHFLYLDGCVYIHGLPAGQKVGNVRANPAVSFTAYEMDCLLLDPQEKPCDTNTKYQSVVVQGTASFLTDAAEKERVLRGIVGKYTPNLAAKALPENMVRGTAVMKLNMTQATGKYYE